MRVDNKQQASQAPFRRKLLRQDGPATLAGPSWNSSTSTMQWSGAPLHVARLAHVAGLVHVARLVHVPGFFHVAGFLHFCSFQREVVLHNIVRCQDVGRYPKRDCTRPRWTATAARIGWRW